MTSDILPVINSFEAPVPKTNKPEWLKIRPPTTEEYAKIKLRIKSLKLNTVCQEAHCPNMSECWSGGTATFMVMGDTCTRGCKFCAVKTSRKPLPLDLQEPVKLAEAIKEMNLDYVVITSVDRDDLNDQGANHFAECIQEVKKQNPKILIEVLTPDFRGNTDCLDIVLNAKPDVFAHNIETVQRLQSTVRDPRANYVQSLFVLDYIKKQDSKMYTKSSIMVGLGEQDSEILQTLDDLRSKGVSVVTFGQYLQPSQNHLTVTEFVTPEKFKWFEEQALLKGFLYCASGPFVRSSYKAGEYFLKNVIHSSEINAKP
ncbi:MAG: lipoyl synthase [Candidatus Diapherotrites archaeon]|nr:lipoyl synthase [Candidatus Diapherotrites archaeon]